MNVNTQISRGMERLMCRREGARLEGMHGLSGMGCADTFSGLAGLLEEAGFDASGHVAQMRRKHAAMCERVRRALPVAVNARRLMVETGGDLSGIFSKIGNALKKVAKVGLKLSPSHLIAQKLKIDKLSPSQLLASKIDPKKAKAAKTQAQIDAAAAKKAAKAAAKQAKKDAKAAAALARANAKNLPPDAAGGAVLANESGVLATPDAQQFAQQLVSSAGGGGSAMPPDASMTDTSTEAASDDTIFGIPKPWAIGGGLALVGIGVYALRRRGR